MTDRYERIRDALKMGPTPGPWGLKELPRDMQRDGYKFSISRGGLGWWIAKVTHEANGGSGVANATYIAACDPDTIRDLLSERDALRDYLAARLTAAQQPAAPSEEAGGFDANFLRHIASVCRAAYDLCQPKPQRTPEDPREYHGELCLSELANIADEIERRLAAPSGKAEDGCHCGTWRR